MQTNRLPCAFCAGKQNPSPQYPRGENRTYGENQLVKRCYSLKRNKEFRHVYRKGQSKAARQLVLVYAKAGVKSKQPPVRVGFSVSKKLGNSVVRNRVKRRLRESFGPMIPCVKGGYNLIFIAREPVVDEEFTAIQSAMRSLLRRANLLKEEKKKTNEHSAKRDPEGAEPKQ